MNRRDFYFRQLVTEADLDEVFTLAEDADHAMTTDAGMVGVHFGLDVAEAGVPNLTVQVTAGSAYDQTGQRIAVPSTQSVNVAVDSNAVSTTVAGVGNSKIISVYAKSRRVLSNPKTDGNNASIQYNRDEGYEFIVRQSTEAVGPTPPALQADEILLADITRAFGGTTIVNAAISTARRQWTIDATNGAFTVKTGRVETAIQSVLDVAGNHIVDAVGAHAATAISNTPAVTIVATTVQGAIDELAGDHAAHLANAVNAHAASAITNTPAGTIVATTVQGAVNELESNKLSKSGAFAFDGTTLSFVATGPLTLRTHTGDADEVVTTRRVYTACDTYAAADSDNLLTITLANDHTYLVKTYFVASGVTGGTHYARESTTVVYATGGALTVVGGIGGVANDTLDASATIVQVSLSSSGLDLSYRVQHTGDANQVRCAVVLELTTLKHA